MSDIADLYLTGKPMRAVAKELGLPLSRVAKEIKAAGLSRDVHTPRCKEARKNIADSKMGSGRGYRVRTSGHVELTGMWDHPLADSSGMLAEHVYVLHREIGDGPHPCNWHDIRNCGKLELRWRERYDGIYVDHLDRNPANNDLANLVVSCFHCNYTRQNPKYSHLWTH